MSPTLFFAVRLPASSCAQLEPYLAGLAGISPAIRPVRADGLHLTLQFLGRVPPESVAALLTVGVAVASDRPRFTIELGELGSFESGHRPTVIWIGLRRGADELAGLNRELGTRLAAARLPQDRRGFRPHLTLARVKGELGETAFAQVAGLGARLRAAEFEPLPVTEIHLMESEPVPGEPNRYRSREALALRLL